MDFFTKNDIDRDRVYEHITSLAKKFSFTFTYRLVDPVSIFMLKFQNNVTLKIDISKYPYPSLAKRKRTQFHIPIDSMLDIAVNKITAITQRTQVKDFVC